MPRPLMQHGVGQLEELFASAKFDVKVLKQLANELKHRQVPRAVTLLRKVQAALDATAPASLASPRAPSPPAKSNETPTRQPDLWGRPPLELTAAKSTAEGTWSGESALGAEPPPVPIDAKSDPNAEDTVTGNIVEALHPPVVSTPAKPPMTGAPQSAVRTAPPVSNAKAAPPEGLAESPAVQAYDMPVSEAYKLLKATPGSSWETIEQTRRRLVDQSSPTVLASLGGEERARILSGAKRVNVACVVVWRARTGVSRWSGN